MAKKWNEIIRSISFWAKLWFWYFRRRCMKKLHCCWYKKLSKSTKSPWEQVPKDTERRTTRAPPMHTGCLLGWEHTDPPASAAEKILLLASCSLTLEHCRNTSAVREQRAGNKLHIHEITACERFSSFIWDLFAQLYLYLCCSLIWSCGGAEIFPTICWMYLPPPKANTVVGCGGALLPCCFIASAMYSRVLMGFSNLTTGLEIMKGDKEHW